MSYPQQGFPLLSAWLFYKGCYCKRGKSFGADVNVMPEGGVMGCILAHKPTQAVNGAQVCVS